MKKSPFFNIIVDNESKRGLGLMESSLLDEAAEQAIRLKRHERHAFYKGIVCGAAGLFCLCLPVGLILKSNPQQPASSVSTAAPVQEAISTQQAQTLKKLVHTVAACEQKSTQSIYSQIRRKAQVKSYKKVPKEAYPGIIKELKTRVCS